MSGDENKNVERSLEQRRTIILEQLRKKMNRVKSSWNNTDKNGRLKKIDRSPTKREIKSKNKLTI